MAIQVIDYDPEWPSLFRQIVGELEPFLADLTPVFHHVGSTSVPGLAAARATAAILSVTATVVFGLANSILIPAVPHAGPAPVYAAATGPTP